MRPGRSSPGPRESSGVTSTNTTAHQWPRSQPGDRQEQQQRVVVPQDRRQQLARDHRHEVRRRGRQPERRDHDRDERERHRRPLDEGRGVPRDAQPVGNGTRRHVVGRRDRVADAADEREEVRPRLRPGEERREHARATASTTPPGDDRRQRRVSSAHDEDEPRLDLDRRAERAGHAQRAGRGRATASRARTAGTAAGRPGRA